ncbi:MAG: PilZ domain-containing protein [Pyrinomonadaceae bacterium]
MLISETDSTTTAKIPAQAAAVDKENRRIHRISLPLPVRIEVKVDGQVGWNEITRLSDVSAFGAGFSLKRPVKRGRLVLLTIPMPRQLRSYDYSEPQYKIWGVVRRCIAINENPKNPEYVAGVAFIGKTPPAGYIEHPSRLYDISHREGGGDGFWHLVPADLNADERELPKDLRKQTRFHIPESLILERVDEGGNVTETETTVSENISLGGAAVFTSLTAPPGSFLRVTSHRFSVTILSVVRGSRVGPDGITRLHLEFIDRFFPLEGIESD